MLACLLLVCAQLAGICGRKRAVEEPSSVPCSLVCSCQNCTNPLTALGHERQSTARGFISSCVGVALESRRGAEIFLSFTKRRLTGPGKPRQQQRTAWQLLSVALRFTGKLSQWSVCTVCWTSKASQYRKANRENFRLHITFRCFRLLIRRVQVTDSSRLCKSDALYKTLSSAKLPDTTEHNNHGCLTPRNRVLYRRNCQHRYSPP